MALASDYNPGSNYSYNMQTVISQGAFLMKIPVEAAINMTTINGAHALQLGADRGSLEVGKRADLLILDIPSHLHLGYHYGSNMVREVICKGHSYSIPKFRFN
jgi:imidazolonepropionase